MITEKRREELEKMFKDFTDYLFAKGEMPDLYVVYFDDGYQVLDQLPSNITRKETAILVKEYAMAVQAELVLHISEGVTKYKNNCEREEMVLLIRDATGKAFAINGEIKKSLGSRFVTEWRWNEDIETNTILNFSQ